MLVEITGFESGHCDIQVGLDDRGKIALVRAEVKSLDVIVVWQQTIYLCFDENVGNYGGQVIRRDRFTQVEWVWLLDDLHCFLELMEFAQGCLLLLEPASLLDGHFPGVAHLIIDRDTESTGW